MSAGKGRHGSGSGAKPAEASKEGKGSGAKSAEAGVKDHDDSGLNPRGRKPSFSLPAAAVSRKSGRRGEETSDIELPSGSGSGAYSGPIQPSHANVHPTAQLPGSRVHGAAALITHGLPNAFPSLCAFSSLSRFATGSKLVCVGRQGSPRLGLGRQAC